MARDEVPWASVDDIDWRTWVPQQRATLMFIIRGGRILLIHKKRGLGAGKINGAGGRLEAGETPVQAACREMEEELRIRPRDPMRAGTLAFQFLDGLSLAVTVFHARGIRRHTGGNGRSHAAVVCPGSDPVSARCGMTIPVDAA